MNLSTFFPSSWVWPVVGSIGVSLLGFGMVQTDRLHKTQMQFSQAQAAWSDQKAKAATAAQQAEFDARLEEKRRYDAQKAIQDDLQHQLEMVRTDSVNARAAADRLQQRVATLIAQASKPASNPAPVESSSTAQDAGDLLSILFGRISDRASELAEYADQARLAGQACEASYGALTP